MSQSESPAPELWSRVRAVLRRPLVAALVAGSALVLARPDLGREIRLHHRLPALDCGDELYVVALDPQRSVARSMKKQLSGEPELDHAFRLPRGAYTFRAEIGCTRSGAAEPMRERQAEVGEDERLDLDESAACPCKAQRR